MVNGDIKNGLPALYWTYISINSKQFQLNHLYLILNLLENFLRSLYTLNLA